MFSPFSSCSYTKAHEGHRVAREISVQEISLVASLQFLLYKCSYREHKGTIHISESIQLKPNIGSLQSLAIVTHIVRTCCTSQGDHSISCSNLTPLSNNEKDSNFPVWLWNLLPKWENSYSLSQNTCIFRMNRESTCHIMTRTFDIVWKILSPIYISRA